MSVSDDEPSVRTDSESFAAAGVFVFEATTGTESVHTVRLNSAFKDTMATPANRLWSHLDLGRPVIDVGLAIQEHDLIAIVTYS